MTSTQQLAQADDMEVPTEGQETAVRSKRTVEPFRMAALPEGLFLKYQALIYREAGIWLGAHKEALLTGRLARRLRLLGIESMAEYYKLVTQPDQQHERSQMLDCITTNETHFFREPRHFDYLVSTVIPRLEQELATGRRSNKLRIWSAGCSSGEEPYSLAMLMTKHLSAENGWDLEVVGTDISTRVLEKAREGMYPLAKSSEIPKEYLQEFMLRGQGDSAHLMKVDAPLRKMVRFARLNLNGDSYPLDGQFDLIFCRNVLIYFDQASKQKVIAGLLRHLSPNGLLFVGHSENLTGISTEVRSVVSTVYARTSQFPTEGRRR